jgi:hypothetical protein
MVEQTAWQAVPAMLFVQRNEFGLNALLGRRLELPAREHKYSWVDMQGGSQRLGALNA